MVPGERQKQKLDMETKVRYEARMRVLLSKIIPIKPYYATLFKGLKVGHPENVALVHPFVFILRRVFLAFAIIFMRNQGVLAVLILQAFALF